ncbi:ATP-dependent transcription regulator LuxR [Ktedonobacter racemifer DSM 44963]|uniref:ATP-dependent transcription regulator LuxR n=2 Tax=Ktedonobacter racemifer TaxID=363277 RepID=D6U8V0_KTERA|nr:ATP-dependent transcription regulator LuxR [Ktedonobacter racemifer DSM 44963]
MHTLIATLATQLAPLGTDPGKFQDVQSWFDNLVTIFQIAAGSVLVISLLCSIIFLATSLGGERRKAAAITSLIFVVIGGVLLAGLSTFQTIIQHIAGK